ncbi:MAG: esterase family protein [Pyrinomonadaceae bacterium MAG19_C2-C3]|nr:esterase family protein [Pyrinomonadaceae bacterium MAG19_C2-C3]
MNPKKTYLALITLIILATLSQATYAQRPAPASSPSRTAQTATAQSRVRRIDFKSQLVGKTLPYNVILPADYDAPAGKSKRYPVLYLLHGLTGNFTNWAAKSNLANHAARHKFIIVTPEGENSWYTDSPVVETEKYESYIVRELIPDVETRFRTLKTRNSRFIAGLSMGGYGALKFGMKYPDMFAVAASMSGALMAPRWTGTALTAGRDGGNNPFSITLRRSIAQAFGEANNPARDANDLFKIARELPAARRAALPFLYLDCGTEDSLIGVNRELAILLTEQKIPHEYRELPGRHDWKYWDAQVQEVLRLMEKKMSLTPQTQY